MLLAVALVAAISVASVGAFGGSSPSTPAADGPEAGFSRAMQLHHNQGVELALIARDRSDDEYFRILTYDMAVTQAQQSGQMYGWLEAWEMPHFSTEDPMAWMEGTDAHESHAAPSDEGPGLMPGMASPEQIAELQELSGVAAEARFLELMIMHHQGALEMADAVLELSDNSAVTTLATAIEASQTAEIELLESLLEERR